MPPIGPLNSNVPSSPSGDWDRSVVRIAVMGATGSGKTTFINLASGSNPPLPTGSESREAGIQLSDEFTLDGRSVTLIDTPGFDFPSGAEDVLKTIAVFLATIYGEGSELDGIIYVYPICHGGMTGITGRNFGTFCELCGDMTLSNVVLVTNMWGATSRQVGEAREKELPTNIFKLALGKGAQMVRYHDTVQSAHDIIRMIMKNRPIALPIQRELVTEQKGVIDTTAGKVINRESEGQIRRYQAELESLREEKRRLQEEHEQQLADLTRRLQDTTNPSAADRERSEQDPLATAATMPPPLPLRRPTPPLHLQEQASASERRSTPAPLVRIAVMGATGSGKTTFINLASGSNLRIGMGLESCTAEVQLASEFTLDGRPVVLIDTPGFDDTSKSDTEILKMIAFFLADTYEEGSTLSGVIYLHRISDNRFGGISGRNFNIFRKLCGESTLKNVVLVTNMWSVTPHHINEARERQLSSRFFKSALDNGSQMVRHHNTLESVHDIIRKIMDNRPAVLQIQRELVDERKDIVDTAAGETVDQELRELIRRHQVELSEVREEMAQALRGKDEEMKQKLEEIKRDLEEKVEGVEEALETMVANYAVEKERAEARMREMEEEAKQDRERAEAEYNGRLAALTSRLQLATSAPAADRAELEREIRILQDRVTIPIYNACNGEYETSSTRPYLSTDRVSNVRKELLKGARPPGIFARRRYVEVILHGETEGEFLEDLEAHRYEMMGHVSRLVYWTHADIDRKVEEITLGSHGFSKVAVGAVAALVGRAEYYQRLLSARNTRDELLDPSIGGAQWELVD